MKTQPNSGLEGAYIKYYTFILQFIDKDSAILDTLDCIAFDWLVVIKDGLAVLPTVEACCSLCDAFTSHRPFGRIDTSKQGCCTQFV